MKAGRGKAKILVVDDHAIVRLGLTQAINREQDMVSCGEAEDAPEAIRLIESTDPDVVLVDISLRDINGIELIKNIRAARPQQMILVVSMHDEKIYAERALRAGARGYIMKDAGIARMIEAIRTVLRGAIYLSEKMTPALLNRAFGGGQTIEHSPIEVLTDRELEVFQLIGQGLTTAEIARQVHLSQKTIETHSAQIRRKLDLKNVVELHQAAFRWRQTLTPVESPPQVTSDPPTGGRDEARHAE